MSLRLALLLAGVVIVAAVYVWGVLRRRHRMRGHYRQRFRAFRPPEPRLTLPDDDLDDDDDLNFQISAVRIIPAPPPAAEPEAADEPAPAPAPKPKPAAIRKEPAPRSAPAREPPPEPAPALRRSPVAPEPGVAPQPEPVSTMSPLANLLKRGPGEPEDLPVVTHEPPARPERKSRKKKEDQMAFTFDGLESAAPPAPPPPPPQPEQQVLSLLLQAPRGKAVSGQDLLKAMNTVGLRYGDMRIFHHFGAGDLKTEVPLFSVANMFEPGYFDLDNLDAFETAGIAFFMQLPSPLDGAVAYELFLNTAQRLAEALKVEVYSEPGKPLDSAAIDRMRRAAGRYAG
ncbi:MAG: cell division protein ZipA [Gammaproteobacteria bacterium]|nr:cell division protein ZipA [Gammaproteobacteria bacterium]MBI5614739.1 cell division protein ZipA [Gammaproteobacteria bacterium]